MELHTERLILKPVVLDDLQNIHALHSCPETDEFNTLGIPASVEETLKLVSEWLMLAATAPIKKHVLSITTKDRKFIGLAGINMGRPAYKSAEIWYKIHPGFWGKGYATEATMVVLDFCFKGLKLHRVEAGCAVDNAASVKVLQKVGMTCEGRCRKKLPIRGQWMDNFEFAILDSEFGNKRS